MEELSYCKLYHLILQESENVKKNTRSLSKCLFIYYFCSIVVIQSTGWFNYFSYSTYSNKHVHVLKALSYCLYKKKKWC